MDTSLAALTTALSAYDIAGEAQRHGLTLVYDAQRKEDGEPVCIKVVLPELGSDRLLERRFVEAGGRAIRLEHPNIGRVYEAAQREGITYVVQEYVEAENLAYHLEHEGAPLPVQAVPIIRQLASALDYAHGLRLMHGDLNDQCVYVEADGRVVLTDFGLTQAAAAGSGSEHTLVDTLKRASNERALAYLAPERLQGQGPSRAGDIYALGVIAYQLLSGQLPFTGEAEAALYQPPLPLHSVNARVPSSLSAAVARALAKRPELRYNTATEFARAFAAAAEGIAPERVPALSSGWQPFNLRLRPVYWAVLLVPILLLLVALAVWGLLTEGEQPVSPAVGLSPSAVSSGRPVTEAPSTVAGGGPGATQPTPAVLPTLLPTQPANPGAPAPTSPPNAPAVTKNSSFSNLVLARGITPDHLPLSPGSQFPPDTGVVYLFFDYQNMQPGVLWGHVWMRGDQEMGRTEVVWPQDWGVVGRAWVYYTPEGSYQPGSYQVRLLVNHQVVATVDFVVQ